MSWPVGVPNPFQMFADQYLSGITVDLTTVMTFGVFAGAVLMGLSSVKDMLLSVARQRRLSHLQSEAGFSDDEVREMELDIKRKRFKFALQKKIYRED